MDSLHSTAGLETLLPWLIAANLFVTAVVGVLFWVFGAGRGMQRQQSIQISDGRRIAGLEDQRNEDHLLRRDMNRDIGRLDLRLSKAEVRIEEHERRLGESHAE